MNTQTITNSKDETLVNSMLVHDLQELSLGEIEGHPSFVVDLTPKSIQDMVDKKILDDLFRFRTCCTDPIASR